MIRRYQMTVLSANGVTVYGWYCLLCDAKQVSTKNEADVELPAQSHEQLHLTQVDGLEFAAQAARWLDMVLDRLPEMYVGFDLQFLATLFEDAADEKTKGQ